MLSLSGFWYPDSTRLIKCMEILSLFALSQKIGVVGSNSLKVGWNSSVKPKESFSFVFFMETFKTFNSIYLKEERAPLQAFYFFKTLLVSWKRNVSCLGMCPFHLCFQVHWLAWCSLWPSLIKFNYSPACCCCCCR